MAFYRIEYYSRALHRQTEFRMILPNDLREKETLPDRPTRTLFVLHGYTGMAENWVPVELTRKYNFAIIMPTAENSFYLNGEATGRAYLSMLGAERPSGARSTFGLARGPEDTYLVGLSMGGFGALHTGLAYPDRFGKIGAMSSALIVHGIAHMKPGEDNGVANYDYYRLCFGDLEQVEESDSNPETLVRKLKGQRMPEIYMCCGTEDFLIEENRQFHRFLEAEGVPHEYHEGPGAHDMRFWSEHVVKVVDWMMA